MININKKFYPLFKKDLDKEFYILYGGRCSGKTWAKIYALIDILIHKDNVTIVNLSPCFSIKDSMYEIKEIIKDMELYLIFNFNATSITNKKNGSSIKFISTKNVDKIKNIKNLFLVALDDLGEGAYKDILNIKNKDFIKLFVFNQPPKYVYDKFSVPKSSDYVEFIYTSFKDNPNITYGLYKYYENMKTNHPKYYEDVVMASTYKNNY